jgi:uncharacterized membrane protein
MLLQFGAAFFYLAAYDDMPPGPPLLGAAFIGAVLIAIAGVSSERLLRRVPQPLSWERALATLLFAWGTAWWLFAGVSEIDAFVGSSRDRSSAFAIFFATTAVAFAWASKRFAWKAAANAARGGWVLVALALVAAVFAAKHPFAGFGWVAWPFALAALGWILHATQQEGGATWRAFSHVAWVVLAAIIGVLELHWMAETYTARATAWSTGSLVVVPACLVLLISSRAADARWPVAANLGAYRQAVPGLFAAGFVLWFLAASLLRDGSSDPLPYLPLLNALDLAHILAGLAAWSAWLAAQRLALGPPADTRRVLLAAAAGLTFLWLNAVLLRTLHHWGDVPFNRQAMMHSVLVQASLSIFWALLALAVMVFGTRRASRVPWMLGAALMGVVVVKLFIVDLSSVGGIARIVSFIAVGVLMLVIGYFSPVPPRAVEKAP